MSKIRLVGGPFGGKVIERPDYGRNEIIITGPKKMTRKQRYEHEVNVYKNPHLMYASAERRYPQVEARYRIAMHPKAGPYVPAMHPDGSIFYEYIEGSKREFK